MTASADSCSDCRFDLPTDIDAFSDGRQPCPMCGSFRRSFSGEARLIGRHDALTASIAAHVATGSTNVYVTDNYDSLLERALEHVETRRVTATETGFAIRFVHPEDDGGAWMAVVDGPDGNMLTADLGDHPDEALAAVIDAIACYDFGGA